MKQRQYHVGPGAVSLLLIIVVVSMSVLGLLSLISARGDYKLTRRAVQLAVAERQTSAEAEETIAQLDAVLTACWQKCETDEEYLSAVLENLPEEMTMDGRVIRWEQLSDSGRTLMCSIEVLPVDHGERFVRLSHRFEAAVGEIYEDMNFDVWE